MVKKIFWLIILGALFLIPAVSFAGTVQLPRTGQKQCYDTDGNVISCTGTGQDGDIKAGVAWPNPRFLQNGNCVIDYLTGLTWLRALPFTYMMTWSQTLDYVSSINSSGGLCGMTNGGSRT